MAEVQPGTGSAACACAQRKILRIIIPDPCIQNTGGKVILGLLTGTWVDWGMGKKGILGITVLWQRWALWPGSLQLSASRGQGKQLKRLQSARPDHSSLKQ